MEFEFDVVIVELYVGFFYGVVVWNVVDDYGVWFCY